MIASGCINELPKLIDWWPNKRRQTSLITPEDTIYILNTGYNIRDVFISCHKLTFHSFNNRLCLSMKPQSDVQIWKAAAGRILSHGGFSSRSSWSTGSVSTCRILLRRGIVAAPSSSGAELRLNVRCRCGNPAQRCKPFILSIVYSVILKIAKRRTLHLLFRNWCVFFLTTRSFHGMLPGLLSEVPSSTPIILCCLWVEVCCLTSYN